MMMHWCSFFFLKKKHFWWGSQIFCWGTIFWSDAISPFTKKGSIYSDVLFFLVWRKKIRSHFLFVLEIVFLFSQIYFVLFNDDSRGMIEFCFFNTLMTNYLDCCPLNCGPNPKVFSAHLELADLVRLRHQISQL